MGDAMAAGMEVKQYLQKRLDSTEECIMALALAKHQINRGVSMQDIQSGFHIDGDRS